MRAIDLASYIWRGLFGFLLLMAIGCGSAERAEMRPEIEEEAAISDELVDDSPGEELIEDEQRPPEEYALEKKAADESPGGLVLNSPQVGAPDGPKYGFRGGRDEPNRGNSGSRPAPQNHRSPGPEIQPDPAEESAAPANDTAVASTEEPQDSALANEPYDMVTLFYATDRKQIGDAASNQRLGLAVLGAGIAGIIAFGWLIWRAMARIPRVRLVCAVFLGLVALAITGVISRQWLDPPPTVAASNVTYGNERGPMDLGTCTVSIPWSHKVAEVERPSILRLEVREDVRKHVVLHTVDPQPEDEFYRHLYDRVQAAERSEVFVFVHGYNVTFESAAHRTAQIAHDVKFQGAPVFFSWPSQGGLLQYTVDETNVAWAVPHLKKFLLDVARKSGAKSVNLIAHSMGNRALTNAIRDLQMELRDEVAMFNQIILAAPDVDAEIFRRDLAPALVRSSNRVTLYASSHDQALVASRKVHGYARAGDTGEGLVVIQGVDTIDVSTIATSLLGHSYYGSSNPVLSDICSLIHEARPAAQREWLTPKPHGSLTYWILQRIKETAALPQ